MIDLSIIIVSYNTKEFLKKCLSSIMGSVSNKLEYEVIVVDNASSDGSKDMIEKELLNRHSGKRGAERIQNRLRSNVAYARDSGQAPIQSGQARMTEDVEVIFIQNKRNVGFSKANNQGVRLSTNSRYVLFLNPDTLVYEHTIDGMVDFMDKTPHAGAATCFVELKNGRLDDSCHRGFPTPLRSMFYFIGLSKVFPKSKFFAGYNMTYLDFNKTHEIDALAGSFMIIRRDVGEKLGWWDEDYFFYGEDIDFCFRIKEIGYKIYFVPEYKTLHYKGVSSGIKKVSQSLTKATKETKLFATKHRFNAMRMFYKKHYQNKYPKFVAYLIYGAIWVKEHL